MRKSGRGLPLFEVALLVVVGAVVGWQVQQRLARMAVEAERIAMELTVANLRTGLRWYQTRQLMGEPGPDVLQMNPLVLLEQLPANYAGVVELGSVNTVEPGNWYFDRALAQLCYRPKAAVEMKGLAVCYALRHKRGAPGEVVLQLTTPYRWK